MTTEKLELRAHDALLRQVGQQLVPEEMRVERFDNPGSAGIVLDDLPEPPRRVRSGPGGFKEIGSALLLLARHVVGEFATKAVGKEDIAVLMALALGNAQVAGL